MSIIEVVGTIQFVPSLNHAADSSGGADVAGKTLTFQQRRQQILGDCKQLKNDVDSYNENRKPEISIQVVFDFGIDLEELHYAREIRKEKRGYVN